MFFLIRLLKLDFLERKGKRTGAWDLELKEVGSSPACPPRPLTCCVSSEKLLHCSETQFPTLQMRQTPPSSQGTYGWGKGTSFHCSLSRP